MRKMASTCKNVGGRSDDPGKDDSRKMSHKVVRRVLAELIRDLLGKFRGALAEAKKNRPRRRARDPFPDVITLEIEGCVVPASTRTRNFHILLGPQAMHWITSGLRDALTRHYSSITQAISHNEAQCTQSASLHYLRYRNDVRDKVHWVPGTMSWALSTKAGE